MWVSVVSGVFVVCPVSGGVLDPWEVRRGLHSHPELLDKSLASRVVGALADDPEVSSVLSFERLLPTPLGLTEQEVWLWRQENWGTPDDAFMCSLLPEVPGEVAEKFGLSDAEVGQCVTYRFFSRVYAPSVWLNALAASLPECRLFYLWHNEMAARWGVYVWDRGVLTTNDLVLGEVTTRNIFQHYPDPNVEFLKNSA